MNLKMDRSNAFAPSSDSLVRLIGRIMPTQALHGGDSETATRDHGGQASISTERLLKSVHGGKAGILQENRKPPRL